MPMVGSAAESPGTAYSRNTGPRGRPKASASVVGGANVGDCAPNAGTRRSRTVAARAERTPSDASPPSKRLSPLWPDGPEPHRCDPTLKRPGWVGSVMGLDSGSALAPLPTAAVADACVRLKVTPRAVAGIRPVLPGTTVAGPVLPVRHAGSVDVFFEALQAVTPALRDAGAPVLCIDNGGSLDEGCIGDLTALEALHHGCAAILVDGAHRDTAALRTLGLPVWSRGTSPFGPLAARMRPADALSSASVGGHAVTAEDVVALDDDGAVFVPRAQAAKVWGLAARIQLTEAEQARLAG